MGDGNSRVSEKGVSITKSSRTRACRDTGVDVHIFLTSGCPSPEGSGLQSTRGTVQPLANITAHDPPGLLVFDLVRVQ